MNTTLDTVAVKLTAYDLQAHIPAFDSYGRFTKAACNAWHRAGYNDEDAQVLYQRRDATIATVQNGWWRILHHQTESTFYHHLEFFTTCPPFLSIDLERTMRREGLHLIDETIIKPLSPFFYALGQALGAPPHQGHLCFEPIEHAVHLFLPLTEHTPLLAIDAHVRAIRSQWSDGRRTPSAHETLHARTRTIWSV